MKYEIEGTIYHREPVKISNLDLGDIVMIKNYRSGSLDLPSSGPCIFLEFTNNYKTSAIVYNTNTQRLHRVRISHISPVRACIGHT